MATQYVEGFEPIEAPSYVEGFEPIQAVPAVNAIVPSATNPQGFTAEQQVIANQFIAQAQRPTLSKVVEGAMGLGGALATPFVSIARGIGELPTAARNPSQILPTLGETGRRVGIDIVNLGSMLSRLTGGPEIPIGPGSVREAPSLSGAISSALPIIPITQNLIQGFGNLAPYTPTQEEIAQAVADAPFQEEIGIERQNVAFEGANPVLSEGLAQAIELAPPIKGAQALRGISLNVAKASPSKILRAAIKPAKQFGQRVEKALDSTIGDIYHANPNADTLAATQYEGFHQSLSQVFNNVGKELDEGLKAAAAPTNSGDQIGAALNKRADELAKAGQPKEVVDFLANRAEAFRGQVNEMSSLREAVTMANRANSKVFQMSREAAAPLLGQAETISNEIIAKTGGAIENKALEALKGPSGALLRKKWSDLKIVEQESSKQLNKLINSAPPEIRSALTSAFTSLEGAAGLVGLVQGYAAGIIPVVSSAAKAWVKRSDKLLKDSNSLVTSAYEKLRANPPKAPAQSVTQTPVPVAVTPTVSAAPVAGTPFSTPITSAVAGPVPTTPIPPPVPTVNTVEQAIAEAAFPTRPLAGQAGSFNRVNTGNLSTMDIDALIEQFNAYRDAGMTTQAEVIAAILRSQR